MVMRPGALSSNPDGSFSSLPSREMDDTSSKKDDHYDKTEKKSSFSAAAVGSHHHRSAFEIEPPGGIASPGGGGGGGGLLQFWEDEYESSSDDIGGDPHASGLGGDLTSAVLGIIKGMVGPAILYLPHGFAGAGYLAALPIMWISTMLYLHSSRCLLDAWKYTTEKLKVEHDEEETKPTTTTTTVDRGGLLPSSSLQETEETSTSSNAKASSKDKASISYPELAGRAYGPRGESIVKIGIASMQSGVCLTYLIFVPHNLHASLAILFGWHDVSPNVYLVLMVLVQIPLSWIRDIRKFTVTNALANALILYGLLLCLYFAFEESLQPWIPNNNDNNNSGDSINNSTLAFKTNYYNDHVARIAPETTYSDSTEDSSAWTNFWDHVADLHPFAKHWILFIGTSVLLFEGSITLLLPLQEAVLPGGSTPTSRGGAALLPQEDPSTANTGSSINVEVDNPRARFPSVYRQVIIGIQVFYVIFGTSCWMAFGDNVNTVLTTSLPPGMLATTVQLAYSVAVMFTFPLQNFPALDISCRAIAKSLASALSTRSCGLPRHVLQLLLKRNFISSVLVCALAVVAYTTMDSLDKVVSLMGSFVGCPVAFIIPPLIHSNVVPHLPPERIMANHFVALLGSVAMVFASLTTIWEWNEK